MTRNVWDEMRKMQRKMNRFWHGFDENPWEDEEEDLTGYRKAWVDARESEEEFLIAVELPGVDKKDIEVITEENAIAIKVEKKTEKKQEDREKGSYSYEESFTGFYRRIPMPESADLGNIGAEYKNGILRLRVPKLEKAKKKSKKVAIN
jgi:HSP20 family protein